MIYFVLDRTNDFTIRILREKRLPEIAHRIRIIHYDEISKLNNLNVSTLIFSDFDRLSPSQLSNVYQIQKNLQSQNPGLSILNKVSSIKPRFELLKALYEEGINMYNVHRPNKLEDRIRFPVFLREDNEHLGPCSPLLWNMNELKYYLVYTRFLGYSKSNLMITEFCDTSDHNHVFHKYSATKIGDDIYPHFLDFSKSWVVKVDVGISDFPFRLTKYQEFMFKNPFTSQLRRVFQVAGVDYGRVDFGILNDQIQVWEINLNPSFGNYRTKKDVDREFLKMSMVFHEKFKNKLIKLDTVPETNINISISKNIEKNLMPSLRRKLKREFHTHLNAKKKPYNVMAQGIKTAALYSARAYIALRNRTA